MLNRIPNGLRVFQQTHQENYIQSHSNPFRLISNVTEVTTFCFRLFRGQVLQINPVVLQTETNTYLLCKYKTHSRKLRKG